ncbi:MAG: hypothetical protein RSB93_01110 [Rikenellaceae bacterium]
MTTVEKFDLNTIYSVVYFDATQRYYYLKRFKVEDDGKMQQFVDVEDGSYMVAISKDAYPLLHVSYGGVNRGRPAEDIDVDEFIGVKSCRAKGKRLSIYKIETVEFAEPLQKGDVNNGGDQDIEEQEKEEPLVDEALTDSNETKIEPEGRGIINMPSIFDELF